MYLKETWRKKKNFSVTRKGTDSEYLLELSSFCSEELLQCFSLKCLHMRSVSTTRDETFITLWVMFAGSIVLIIVVIIALMSGGYKIKVFLSLFLYKSNKNVCFCSPLYEQYNWSHSLTSYVDSFYFIMKIRLSQVFLYSKKEI
jgi:hypothetical protein